MPGAGKSEAMNVARAQGHPVVRMGDLIWEEVERRGLPRTSEYVGPVANGMREEHGPDIWALRTVERIQTGHPDSPIVLIDGIRSIHEVEVFRRELADDFTLVAIHTPESARFHRMTTRARDDDPVDEDGHRARDQREMGWGIARTIALADEMIVNDSSLDAFKAKVADLLERL